MASKILLADDSITIQKVVNLTFADEGIDVVAVSNGEMAERRLGEINPDLVLADIFMPGKNGYELCEFIKQSPDFRDIPVILLVGAFEPFDQVEARRVRADAHLTKPFESRTLVETVRRLITNSGKRVTNPLATPAPTEEDVERSSPQSGYSGAPDTRPLPPPSFNIDLNAMSGDWPPAEQTPQEGGHPYPQAQSRSQPAPIDSFRLDESVFGDAPDDPALDIQMGAPAREGEPSFDPSTFSNECTAAQARSAESLVFEEASAPVDDFADPFKNLFTSQEESASTEAQQAPAKGAGPAFAPTDAGDEDQYMSVDFERNGALDRAGRGSLSFDMNSKRASDQGPGDTFEFTSEGYVGDRLQGATDPNHVSPSFDAASENFETRDSGLKFIEQPLEGASPGALFAVDDPLGDVLMGASVDEPPEIQSQAAQEPEPFQVEQADNPLNLEVPRAAPGPSAFTWDQGVDLASTSAGADEGLSFEENFSSDQFSATIEGNEPEAARYRPAVGEHAFTTEEMLDRGPREHEGASIEALPGQQGAGWGETSTGFEFSDPGFHPIDEDETEPISLAGEAFTSASMWSGQDARTASIDIEARAVEEPTPVTVDAGTAREEVEFVQNSPTQVEPESPVQAEKPQSGSLELSPSVIDEIVRRVVAQMSESVVKEIAWEVVPDCVERVIENLTRESLSKNH